MITADATISPVAMCIEWLFTITGHPAAKADAVSPPAVEKANGKLLDPKTTTGPNGTSILRKSSFGSGARSGIAVSIVASSQLPSKSILAKERN